MAVVTVDLRKAPKYVPIPVFAYDCHTAAGRKKGRTKTPFIQDDQQALKQHQPGLFDNLVDNLVDGL